MFWKAMQCVSLTLLFIAPSYPDTLGELIGTESAPANGAVTERVIDTKLSPLKDVEIQERITSIYAELRDLEGIFVDVNNSVVTLSGEAGSSQAVDRATRLASQVEGVVEVVNELSIDTNVGRRVDKMLAKLKATGISLIALLPMLVLALVSVVFCWFVGRWLARKNGVFRRIAPNVFIAELLANIAWLGITLIGVLFALTLLDATSIIGTVLGAAGIFGLAVGFAVRDTVENYIASILLSLRHPFAARDYISIGDQEGSVARLTSRATILISPDGNHVRIPNSTVFKSIITNYTRNPFRRLEFLLGVDSEANLVDVQELACETLESVPGILDDPATSILIDELGDSNVTLRVRGWVDQRTHDLSKVRSEAIRSVKREFDKAGIVMPEPIYRVLINQPIPAEKPAQKSTPAEKHADASDEGVPQDTSADTSVDETLSAEINSSDSENLLEIGTPSE